MKYKIKKNLFTVSGTLYIDEVVKTDKKVIKDSKGKIKVKDQVGKIWHILPEYLKEVT
jgi:hypothetical protein